jgi:hypothetical protein
LLTRLDDDGSIKTQQPKLLTALFDEFADELSKTKKKKVTAPTSQSLINVKSTTSTSISKYNDNTIILANNDSENRNNNILLKKKYLHLLGSTLMYATKSRPDIKFATSLAATKKSSNPTEEDYQQLVHIMKYLYDTKDLGLVLHLVENCNDPLQYYCYVDASYILHPDSTSHTGYLITFEKSGSFVSKSMKKNLVAASSTHAETIALFSLVKDIRYLLDLSDELRIRIGTPIMVFDDNKKP